MERTRVIKEYKPCEICKGSGLEDNGIPYGIEGHHRWDCRVCDGYGKVIVNERKEVITNE